ncbi:ABC transporter permease [Phytomonospora sp. NPDC050363]|uniref:ABC transporter permease n=1 Tax=Phytomonospora sp. NPDC050363 TaxID=3155642 RepID=UPI0033CCA8EE
MVKSFAISLRLLRGAGRHGLLGTLLTVVAVAVSTMLLLAALAANGAFAARAERAAWQTPSPTSPESATAVQSTSVEYFQDKPVTVIRLAALDPAAPVPPGLPAFPKPGEFYASPDLTGLLASTPADQLADRFPARTGGLDRSVLAAPGQLVAVLGLEAADPFLTVPDGAPVDPGTVPTHIADFGGAPSLDTVIYDLLLKMATAMVVAPLLIFGAAAARLTVARRDTRLAALRLIGATPGQVVSMTVAEAVLTAVIGAVLGALVYLAGFAGLAQIPMQGQTWFTSDLWVGLPWLLAVLAAVPVLTGVSAAIGLRRVVVSPLGVAQRQTPPGLRAIRLVALAAALIAASFVTAGTGAMMVMIVLGAVFLAINLVGPWVVGIIGRISAAFARGPARLLAARRLVDDPRAAWRTVAGVALTGFVAGFVGLLSPATLETTDSDRTVLSLRAEDASAVDDVTAVLAAKGIDGGVEVAESGKDYAYIAVTVADDPATVDRAKAALTGVVPGQAPIADSDQAAEGRILLGDVQVGVRIVLIVSFLVAIASAGIASASSVLDRRRTYGLLRLAGTPLKVLNHARAIETRIPLLVMGGGAILVGIFCGVPFAAAGAFSPSGLITLATCVVLGFGGVVAASALSRPLLDSVTSSPTPSPD